MRLNIKMKQFERIDLPLIRVQYRRERIPVSRKDIRLYSDLIDIWYPLYKDVDLRSKAEFISEVFKCVCTEEDLNKLKSFKDITKKNVLTMENENVKTIKRLRWRSRGNLQKNIIHFQN
jgi:excinuclease UvrABC helicase subunit UvrB